jgi:hypothetical protein
LKICFDGIYKVKGKNDNEELDPYSSEEILRQINQNNE